MVIVDLRLPDADGLDILAKVSDGATSVSREMVLKDLKDRKVYQEKMEYRDLLVHKALKEIMVHKVFKDLKD